MSTSAHERSCWQSNCAARDIANSLFQKWAIKGFFPRRVSEANRGRGQPRRGYRRPKPATRSGAGRKSCRAAGFLLHTFLSPPKEKCERPIGLQALFSRRSRRVNPPKGICLRQSCCPLMQCRVAVLGANNRRGPRCRAFHLLFA